MTYNIMTRSRLWWLKSGVCVEDVLFKCFKDSVVEYAVHSWVLDTRDSNVRKCFSASDWEEIRQKIPPLKAPNQDFVESINEVLNIKPGEDLRNHLDTTPPFTIGELSELNERERRLRTWAYDVLRAWALLCVDSSSFTQDHDEVWYVCRFWAALFDNCIISIPGAYISRSEVSTRSTAARKNLDSTKRRRAGPLFDGTISVHDQELGAFEHGRTWTDETDRKWVADSRKIVKALHDMLHRLQRPDIQVAGIVTAAWHCQMLRMVYGGGYCCVLAADKVHQVPTPQQDIELLLELIAVAWMMQEALRVSTAKMAKAQDLRHSWMNPKEATDAMPLDPLIPRSAETDDEDETDGQEDPRFPEIVDAAVI